MGVPKFYRWISERYPCLSEVVREYQIPEFDNLYLDMNGIIHLCSHPNDEDPHFRITEEKIFLDIFHYIEILFRLIKPQKVFFMAVDGVAPRAKMNQQRGRRFRSAREAEELEARAKQRGEILPKEERFDSNCITPGTVFMAKLHEQLKYFVTMKISTDKMWKGIRVYLSGHETPGEGEHKIMDFIRYEKSQPDYNPNTRHCLYGLDADLIMLGLCTHEPHFSLLREEVRFTGKKSQQRISTPEETTFHLLHLSLMREYLDFEFSAVKNKISFVYDLEKIIDDWVLMGFLVGNDFIPNLPHMHIAHDALPMLYKAYVDVLPSLDGYINEGGYLNLLRFEKYLKRVAQFDYEHFNDTYADLKWFEGKCSKNAQETKKAIRSPKKKAADDNMFSVLSKMTNDLCFDDTDMKKDIGKDLSSLDLGNLIDLESSEEEEEEEEEQSDNESADDLFEMEFRQHKRDYYMNKLEYDNVTPEVLRDQAEGYIRAIQWNLHYYYNGVCSWSWYYPHHYAPYISDIKDFGDLNIKFDIGKPFLPFEQLLAVLPAASKKLLPKAYQSLMFDQNSPVIDFYPVDFKTDKNGKQQDWEAVVLIPFINEKRLLEAMKPLELLLTDDEKRRNRCGPCLLYTYSETSLGSYLSSLPDAFPDIEFNYAVCEEIPREFFAVPASELKKGLCSKVTLDVYFPGFPTLKHIKHKAELKKAGVQVFQMSSKNENMILQITEEKNPDLSELAKEILGKSIFVSWPHLVEARVICVSSEKERYSWNEMMKPSNDNSLNEKMNFRHEELKEREIDLWHITKRNIKEHYFHRLGIEIGDTHVIVEAQPVMGRKYIYTSRGTVTLQKHWANQPLTYVLQATVKDITVHDSAFVKYKTVDELFKPKALCFMLGFPHYGHMAEVTEFNHETGRVNVSVHIPQEPDFEPVLKKRHTLTKNYMPGYIVAQKLNINSHLVSRITGTLLVIPDSGENSTSQKVNIGLNLKFNKKNQEVPGFTKKVNETWSYSDDTVKIINEYSMKFPEIFEKIARFSNSSTFYADELIPDGKSAEVLQEIQTWLKSLPCYKAEHQKCGSDIIEEPVVLELEKSIDELKANKRKGTLKQKMEVKPQLLYLYSSTHRSSAPDSGTQYYLFDRVVNVREGHSVPFGLRGTVIGIHSAEKEADTMFDILFDDKFAGGLSLRCSENRGYRMPAYSLINISHGIRKDQSRGKNSQKKSNETKYSIATKLPSNSNYFSRSPQSNNITSRQPQNQILNHSPNSPFVPQMGSSNKTTKHNNEFLSIWHQLQQSGNVQPPKLDNSFQNAAKALHNVPPNRYSKSNTNNRNQKQYTYEKSLDYTEGNDPPRGNISDLNYVPKQKDNILFQPSHYSYKRLEGQHNNDSVAMKTESHQIKSNEKQKNFSYVRNASKAQNLGQQVSLEELFRGAQLHESSKNFSKLEGKKPRENTYPDPSNKEYHAADSLFSRPVNPTKPSAVMDLMNFLSSSHLGSPIYQYLPLGPNQLTVAQVKLSNGFNFTGTPCATKEDAAESAALTTLNHLKLLAKVEQAPSFTPSWAQGPRPSLPLNYSNQGPNRFQMGMPKLGFMLPNQQLGFQHPMSKPIPPFNPMASNKRNFHQGRNYHNQGGHTAIEQHCSPPKNQVVNSGMQDSNLRRENPFIPMQVMKQNLVPKKKAEKNSEVLSSEKGKSSSGNFNPTKSSQVAEAAQSRQNTLNTSTSNSSPDKSKPSRARGRGRSRLAINFKNSMT